MQHSLFSTQRHKKYYSSNSWKTEKFHLNKTHQSPHTTGKVVYLWILKENTRKYFEKWDYPKKLHCKNRKLIKSDYGPLDFFHWKSLTTCSNVIQNDEWIRPGMRNEFHSVLWFIFHRIHSVMSSFVCLSFLSLCNLLMQNLLHFDQKQIFKIIGFCLIALAFWWKCERRS